MDKKELVGLNIAVPKETRKDFKMLATLKNMTMTAMFLEMFSDYKKKHLGK